MTTDTLTAAPTLGVELAVTALSDLTGDPAALSRLQQDLDRHLLVRISSKTLPTPEAIEALANFLGKPRSMPTGVDLPCIGAQRIIGDFSARARPDDGRPRVRGFIEGLHYDMLADGLAAYGIQHSRQVPATTAMNWVDMRAVYTALPEALKRRIAPLSVMHYPRASMAEPRPAGFLQPLVARHPRTGETVLLLPNKRDSRAEGLDEAEGRALIADLWDRVEASPARHSQVMQSGDIYVWDDIAAVHDNPAFPRDQDRTIWFLNVPGVGPLTAA